MEYFIYMCLLNMSTVLSLILLDVGHWKNVHIIIFKKMHVNNNLYSAINLHSAFYIVKRQVHAQGAYNLDIDTTIETTDRERVKPFCLIHTVI